MDKHIKKNIAGGAATAAGINFQAAVTAIAYVYMARGVKLNWLNGIAKDIPVSVEAESGGAGDDLRLVMESDEIVEIQIKKGLSKSQKLWTALKKLSHAISSNEIDYGLLIVSPSSSNTISEHLSQDIRKIGDGRTNELSNIGKEWLKILKTSNYSVEKCCKNIRIQTINAVEQNQSSIHAAKAELAHICVDNNVELAWNSLYKDATLIIETKGRRDVSRILRLLSVDGVELKQNKIDSSILLLNKITNWTAQTQSYFTIIGLDKKLNIDSAWIPMQVTIKNSKNEFIEEDLNVALENYQTWHERRIPNDTKRIDSDTLGRFVKRCVLIGGPGMGKTTLLKRISLSYSADKIPVLNIKLSSVASSMKNGRSFEESVFSLGLDGSNVSKSELKQGSISNWFLLCDGLDECGNKQTDVAAGIIAFGEGYPQCRILITTRPIGYETPLFENWRHYDLAPLKLDSSRKNLKTLLTECSIDNTTENLDAVEKNTFELNNKKINNLVARSPLMLGICASIIFNGKKLGDSKEHYYRQAFDIIKKIPSTRNEGVHVGDGILNRFIEILGWEITSTPFSSVSEISAKCSEILMGEVPCSNLIAQEYSENCLQFWESAGMIEKIGVGNNKIYSFIHKSFGEFAAAQYFSKLTNNEQCLRITELIDESKWAEVIRFALHIGLSNHAIELSITGNPEGTKQVERLCLFIEILSDSNRDTEQNLLELLIDKSVQLLKSPNRVLAVKIFRPLLQVVEKFPNEIGVRVSNYLTSNQSWTFFSAWTLSITAGEEHYELEKLVDIVSGFSDKTSPMMRVSSSGRLSLNLNPETEIQQQFILKAVSVLLRKTDSNEYQQICLDALENRNLRTVSFEEKATELLNSFGIDWSIRDKSESASKKLLTFFDSEEYLNAKQSRNDAIFHALEISNEERENIVHKNKLIYLSAFLESSDLNNIPMNDWVSWSVPYDKPSIKEVLRAFISISGIDFNDLREDGIIVKAMIQSSSIKSFYEVTKNVDPPQVNWSKSKTLNLDYKLVETALHHQSMWIVWMSANLLHYSLSKDEKIKIVKRTFKNGRDFSLWGAYALSHEFDEKLKKEIFFERLKKPLVAGCEYLFNLLENVDLSENGELFGVLKVGLNAEPRIAKEASKLLSPNEHVLDEGFTDILSKSFDYWSQKEKNDRPESGSIPPSPRSNILKALIKLVKFEYSELVELVKDDCSDVKVLAEKEMLNFFKINLNKRTNLLNDINDQFVPSYLLSKVFDDDTPFKTEETRIFKKLLSHNIPEIRLHATKILKQPFFHKSFLLENLAILIHDTDQYIVDEAYELLEIINRSG